VEFIKILAIAVALAMDAFAVSIATGVNLKNVNSRQMFRLSWHFGLFQAFMPIIGWSAGLSIRSYIEHYDHWIAFGLLAFVGGHMIKEAFQDGKAEKPIKDYTKGMTLVMLSVATSIDALAVGFGLSLLKISIWMPALIIGIVAGTFTLIGMRIGERIGAAKRLSLYAETIGGVVLISIGLNILYDHGVFSIFFK
jgi:manganese efflux pump family protein